MARTPLNKAELTRRKRALATYQRFLPSLDMKRKQLLSERQRAREERAEVRRESERLRRTVEQVLSMLAYQPIKVERLVDISEVEIEMQNVVGVPLPRLNEVHFDIAPYGYLATPHWIDRLVDLLCKQLREKVREQVATTREAALDVALKTVTQRLNLFDKVLIPRTQEAIKHIEIALGDAERAGVVRAKIAKRKRAEAEP